MVNKLLLVVGVLILIGEACSTSHSVNKKVEPILRDTIYFDAPTLLHGENENCEKIVDFVNKIPKYRIMPVGNNKYIPNTTITLEGYIRCLSKSVYNGFSQNEPILIERLNK